MQTQGFPLQENYTHLLKSGLWVIIFYLRPSLQKHSLGRFLNQQNGWFPECFLRSWLNMSVVKGFSCSWINMSVGTSLFVSVSQINYIDWTLDIFNSNYYHARLVTPWQLTLLSNKHKWERQGCVCGAKKLQGLNLDTNPGLYFAGKLSHRD